MEGRVAKEVADPSGFAGVEQALRDQVNRIDRFIEILDNDALDQLREIVNPITTMERRASGKFV
jgi:hypothetical protein